MCRATARQLNGGVSIEGAWHQTPTATLLHNGRRESAGADCCRRFLARYGNPYVATGADLNGRASIEWGVYGVPETFVVGRDGRIAYKLIGPIEPNNLEKILKPEIEKALAAPAS